MTLRSENHGAIPQKLFTVYRYNTNYSVIHTDVHLPKQICQCDMRLWLFPFTFCLCLFFTTLSFRRRFTSFFSTCLWCCEGTFGPCFKPKIDMATISITILITSKSFHMKCSNQNNYKNR